MRIESRFALEVVATLTPDGDDPREQFWFLSADGRAVTARRLTVTTIGVPLRAELRLKSLLTVMRSRTVDEWSFRDEGPVDLAICDPESALTKLAIKRAGAGTPRLVSLISDDQPPLADTLTLRDPVRVSDFLTLLDSVSSSIREVHAQGSGAAPADAPHDVFRFAGALRAAVRNASRDVFRLQAADFELHVVPAKRQVLLTRPLDPATFSRLLAPELSVEVRQLPETHAAQLVAAGAETQSADTVLWNLGLGVSGGELFPDLPPQGRFSLRRWPDFGRLPHRSAHLRLAARLTRQEMSLEELGAHTDLEPAQIRPFINACALCDLLNARPGRTPVAAPPAVAAQSEPAPPAGRYQMIFRTIRSALRFGAS